MFLSFGGMLMCSLHMGLSTFVIACTDELSCFFVAFGSLLQMLCRFHVVLLWSSSGRGRGVV